MTVSDRPRYLIGAALLSLLLSGAIFGFFYAWICSTMWGLDASDPRVAIRAMQDMNASVRNAVFASAFFGTGPVLLLTGWLASRGGFRAAALLFWGAGAVYLIGGMGLTIMVNVPMNEALALVSVPSDTTQADAIWSAYSARWQVFNVIRTVNSGIAVLLVGVALLRM